MGVPAKARRRAGMFACAALVGLALAACGGDGEVRYVTSPVGTGWGVGAAGVDRDGTVVLTGENRALTIPPGESSDDAAGKSFEAPSELSSDSDPRGVSVDKSRTAWVLVGSTLVPVGAKDGELHPTWESLVAIGERNPGTVVPGAESRLARATTAVAVVDDKSVVVASRPDLGSTTARANVTVHTLDAGGQGKLLAGRAWTGSEDRPRPASELPPGENVRATAVDLDDVVALQPLADGHLMIVTSVPTETSHGRLAFFHCDGTNVRRLETPEAHVGVGNPGVSSSLTADGRVVVNLSTGNGSKPEPAVLSIDPATDASAVIERSTATLDGYGTLLVADADGHGLVAVTPPGGDPDDDDNDVNVRITSTPTPGSN
jgi:hypothetical protein